MAEKALGHAKKAVSSVVADAKDSVHGAINHAKEAASSVVAGARYRVHGAINDAKEKAAGMVALQASQICTSDFWGITSKG